LEGIVVNGYIIGNEVLANSVLFRGIAIGGAIAPHIKNNNIFNMIVTAGVNIAAIELAVIPMLGAIIEGNVIKDLSNRSTSGYGAYGINIAINATNTSIVNNLISNLHSFGWNQTSTSDNDFGIRIVNGNGINIFHNTINMIGTVPANTLNGKGSVFGIIGATVQNVNVSNNILINTTNNPVAGGRS